MELKKILAMMKTEEERSHSRLSASKAKIWTECNMAPFLWDLYPEIEKDDKDDFTQEGTIAHFIAELVLKGKLDYSEIPYEYEDVKIYIDKVLEVKRDGNLLIELQLDMTQILKAKEEIKGTSDVVILQKDHSIDILDLKYGKGVPVSAYKNKQEMLYSLGIIDKLDKLGLIDQDELAHDTSITIHIIQPRIEKYEYTFYKMTWKELYDFSIEVSQKVLEIENKQDLVYVKGEHCQFCKGKAYCPLFVEETQVVINQPVIANFDMVTSIPKDTLIKLYKAKSDIMAFYKALDKYMKAEIELAKDGTFGGFKKELVEGNREVVDEEALIKQLTERGIKLDEIKEAKLVGFAKIDKLAKSVGIDKKDLAGVQKKLEEKVVPVQDYRDAIFEEK